MATPQAGKPGASGWLYVIGIAMALGGCGTSCGVSLWRSADRVDGMLRFEMPGAHHLTLSPGHHVAYAEMRSVLDGKSYTWDGTGSVQCHMAESATQRQVSLTAPSVNESYTFGAREGESMFEFEIEQLGSYVLECEAQGGPVIIAVSRGRVLGGMVFTMLGGFVLGAFGLAIILLTWDKRRKRRRA